MGRARTRQVAALVCVCTALAACDDAADRDSDGPAGRAPAPAPRVELTEADRELWAPGQPDRSAVPVLRYARVRPKAFARQMVLLDNAGYETITLEDFVGFVRGRQVSLPERPLLLTFDGARADSWTGADGILSKLGFEATIFVNVGRVDAQDPHYLSWKELNAMRGSGRWEVQLQAGTGDHLIQYGSTRHDVGPFYAYRGTEERIDGWRERVFSDVTDAERRLAGQIRGHRALAFAPPYGNYGQAGTNDPRIPRKLGALLFETFEVVFARDGNGLASPGAGIGRPLDRIDVTPTLSDEGLHAALEP